MANLAIKGHPTRGKEVIEILEMLGGKNINRIKGYMDGCVYIINHSSKGEIDCFYDVSNIYEVFSLEEFLEKFPYKVGDKVSVYEYESKVRIDDMKWDGFEIQYSVFTDETEWYSAAELNELNKCNKPEETMEEPKELLIGFTKDTDGNWVLNTHKDYEIKYIDSKFKLIKKQLQYPKTYEECLEILGYNIAHTIPMNHGHNGLLMMKLQRLLICRDAYWKMAGEKMGLGKPWESDWNDNTEKYVIYPFQYLYSIDKENYRNTILAFPTEEMRNVFYENFKELIEQCKKLL